jgi:hypothetical protein
LLILLEALDNTYGIEDVVGHNGLNDAECPGYYIDPYIDNANDGVNDEVELD